MRQILSLVAIFLLAGCATPREACVASATRDLNVVRALISQSEGNLNRGYAVRRVQTQSVYSVICPGTGGKHGPIEWCERTHTFNKKVPEAIDLSTERRKLRDLRVKEAQLSRKSSRAIQQCNQSFPDV
jgi:hypothetical protein